MKKISIILFLSLLPLALQAQSALGLFGGVGRSAFDENLFGQGVEYDQASYVPVGVQLVLGSGMIRFGAEAEYAALPFTFEWSESGYKLAEFSFSQLYIGGLVKVRLGGETGIIPYGRAGAGAYLGKEEVTFTDDGRMFFPGIQDRTTDLKTAFGFNLGAGLEITFTKNNSIFGEIIYHYVKRQEDLEGSEAFNASSIALRVGFQFDLSAE